MTNINDISREEKINLVISKFSGHKRMDEIAYILATLTSYKIKGDDYIKYYEELVQEEIKEKISDAILNISLEDILLREEEAWISILNALGIEMVLEIIENWKKYINKSTTIDNKLDTIKKRFYEDYFKELYTDVKATKRR